LVRRILRTWESSAEMLRTWTPAPVPHDIPVTLFRAREVLAIMSAPAANDYGWSRTLARDIQVVDVPGNHVTMMVPPQVATLVACLNDILL
jgi:thioesterase domain-containing protein